MRRTLRETMAAVLEGWQGDLPPAWRALAGDVALDIAGIDPALELEAWEPVFPVRRGRRFPGQPAGAHMLRAFDGPAPEAVRVVVLGQDPYPCPAFSTGRAFEAGNTAAWRELEKMFSTSVRTFMQQIAEARTGDAGYAGLADGWARLIGDVEAGRLALEAPSAIAERWTGQGVLLLNSALTLSRFAVEGDPHQLRGHLLLWRPFMVRVLAGLARGGAVFIGFGGQAADTLAAAGVPAAACILREHPARAAAVLALPNPFVEANRRLTEPVAW